MTISKKIWALVLCIGLLLMTAPAFAADFGGTVKRLKDNGPARHPYFFSVLGGSVIGIGVGAALGGGNDITKGLLAGGGGASTAYLLLNPHSGGPYRSWYLIGGTTAMGTGALWAGCGCTDGAALGAALGFGVPAIYEASHPQRKRTAQTQQKRQP
jgi:hypothetical protein